MAESTEAPPPVPPEWSSDQMVRLQYEWRRLQRSYAFHPIVRVLPVEGDPPSVYQVDYRLRTLEINSTGQLGYAATCSVQFVLPADFPQAPPLVKPLFLSFHPNVDSEQIQIVPPWTPSTTLIDVAERVGRILAFQSYNPQEVWNPVAMDWVLTNPAFVPTDPSADVSTAAGGDPLDRICRSGPATLPSLRDQVRKFCDSMLGPINPPAPTDVAYFSMRTRLAAGMFLDSDIPEALSKQASELDEWAAALPEAERWCALFRQVSAATLTATAMSDALAEAAKRLNLQVHTAKPAGAEDFPSDPRELFARLPATDELQKSLALLKGSLTKAEQRFEAVRATMRSLELAPLTGKFPEGLQVLLDAEVGHKRAMVKDARAQLETKRAAAEPIIARARREAAALARLLQWREFIDTAERARELSANVAEWGSAGVQAYYLENEEGRHGPFDFEQQVDLGAAQVVLRKITQHAVEAVELSAVSILGRSETGELNVTIPGATSDGDFAASFRCTPRCDDLALQLDYAVSQTRALLEKLSAPEPDEPGGSSNGALATAISRPANLQAIRDAHLPPSRGWAGLAADLRALTPFKERLATYHLLIRVHETLPIFQRERAEASAALKKAAERVNAILVRGTKDLETGNTVIPGKYHKEYESLLLESDRQQAIKDRMSAALKNSVAHVQARMAVRKGVASPIGSAKVPKLTALSPMPVDMNELSEAMGDTVILDLVSGIESMVNTQLYFGRRPAAKEKPALAPLAAVEPNAAEAAVAEGEYAAQPTAERSTETSGDETAVPEPAPEAALEQGDAASHEDWPAAGDPGHENVSAQEGAENADEFAVIAEEGHGDEHASDDVFVDWPK